MNPEPLVRNELLFQILPLRYLEPLLRGSLTLVRPSSWDDPYEALPHLFQLVDTRTTPYRIDHLSGYLGPIYAQCWSRTGSSDALLRAYSRVSYIPGTLGNSLVAAEGVKIVSTPERLLRAVEKWSDSGRSCFLEPVEYMSAEEAKGRIYAAVANHGPRHLACGEPLARLHLLKRDWFAHENEVRLLCTGGDPLSAPDVVQIPCDANDVITSIEFDPRLLTYERLERQAFARKAGYNGSFPESSVYQRTLVDAKFPYGWPS